MACRAAVSTGDFTATKCIKGKGLEAQAPTRMVASMCRGRVQWEGPAQLLEQAPHHSPVPRHGLQFAEGLPLTHSCWLHHLPGAPPWDQAFRRGLWGHPKHSPDNGHKPLCMPHTTCTTHTHTLLWLSLRLMCWQCRGGRIHARRAGPSPGC